MPTVIVSDLHAGSPYFLHEHFLRFLESLPPDATLVLNGDTVDRRHRHLPDGHQKVLQALREHSSRRPVIWVRGNHDERFQLPEPANIRFVTNMVAGGDVFVSHGHIFDNIKPYNRWFLVAVHLLHGLRILCGAKPVHVAYYAKRWPRLYRILRTHVAMNAVEHARENGYQIVTCGHTHFAEDARIQGVRYINSGSWTETPMHYLLIQNGSADLCEAVDGRYEGRSGKIDTRPI